MYENIIQSFKRHKREREISSEDHRTLDEKLKLIEDNFNLSDKEYGKYSSLKFKLNNGNLLLGEVIRYRKEIKIIKKDMFDIFRRTWQDLLVYSNDIPSDTLKIYQVRFDTYGYDMKRNTFNQLDL